MYYKSRGGHSTDALQSPNVALTISEVDSLHTANPAYHKGLVWTTPYTLGSTPNIIIKEPRTNKIFFMPSTLFTKTKNKKIYNHFQINNQKTSMVLTPRQYMSQKGNLDEK